MLGSASANVRKHYVGNESSSDNNANPSMHLASRAQETIVFAPHNRAIPTEVEVGGVMSQRAPSAMRLELVNRTK